MNIKMIIIGANGSGYKRTIPALKDSEVCSITAIQSRNEEKLKKICNEYNIPNYYTDIRKILENEEFDLIYIANPPFLHKETISECIKYNKPIICEKPLARDYKEAIEIKEILKDFKQPMMIAHHIRHQKAYRDIKDIINSGKMGEIVSSWIQWGFNINLDAPSSAWKLDKNLGGGGTLSDNGIHAIDLIIGFFGEPNQVKGNSRINKFKETYSNEIMMLNYEDKDIVINSSHTMPFAGNHLLIYGTQGKLEVFGGISEKSINNITITTKNGKEIFNYEEENLYKNEVENFIKYNILNDKTCEKGTTIEEGLISLKLIDELRENF